MQIYSLTCDVYCDHAAKLLNRRSRFPRSRWRFILEEFLVKIVRKLLEASLEVGVTVFEYSSTRNEVTLASVSLFHRDTAMLGNLAKPLKVMVVTDALTQIYIGEQEAHSDRCKP